MKVRQLASALWAALTARRSWLLASIGIRRHYRTRAVEDLPDRLDSSTLYLVTEGELRMYAAMACPRGQCAEPLSMNLLPDDQPMWLLSQHENGSASLYPSIWRKTGCGCHFWLRCGTIEWCKKRGRQTVSGVPRTRSRGRA